MKYFLLKKQHIALLQRMNIYWEDDAYHGAPAVDIKRPYGNSDVWEDVAEIAGFEMFKDDNGEKHFLEGTRNKCLNLHRETAQALQVCLAAQSFDPGEYVADDYRENWRKKT